MKRVEKVTSVLITFIFFLVISCVNAQASNNFPISINAIIPENQIDKEISYYNLKMAPNQQQTLEMEISNLTKEKKKLKVEINNATTNDAGNIDYSKKDAKEKKDPSLNVSLEDMAKTDETITIKPLSKKTIKINLQMPDVEFKGVIVGAVRVSEIENKEKKKDKDSNLQIKNKTVYTTGISLRESDTKVDAELNMIKAFADQENGKNHVKVNIQNNQPEILENITYKAEIFEKGASKPLHESMASSYRMAPNSNFNYKVDWEGEQFKPGDYVVHMIAESKDTKQKWEWNQDFEITKADADKFNDKALKPDEGKSMWWVVIVIILMVAVVVVGFLYRKRKLKEKREVMKNKVN